jgi:large subunit ribosomal protein L29
MKTADIRQMDVAALSKEIAKQKQELLKMKLQTGTAQSKETHKLKDLRRQIARMQTVQKELSSKSAN